MSPPTQSAATAPPPSAGVSWRWWGAAGLLAVAGLVLGLVLGARNPNFGGDSLYYVFPVRNWLQGHGFAYQGRPELLMPPGYGLLAMALSPLAANLEQACMAVSSLAFAACIALACGIGRVCFRPAAGLWAGLFILLSPEIFRNSYIPLADMSSCALYLLSLRLFLAAWRRGSHAGWSAAFGAAIAAAYLVRQEHFALALMACGVLGLQAVLAGAGNPFRHPRRAVLDAWKRPAAALAAFLLVSFPYVLHLHTHTGRWTFSAKIGYNLAEASGPAMGTQAFDLAVARDPARYSAHNDEGLLDNLRRHGAEYAALVRVNSGGLVRCLQQFTYPALAAVALTALAAAGLLRRRAAAGAAGPRTDWRVPFALFAAPALLFLIFFIVNRLIMPYAMLLLIALGGLQGRLAGIMAARLPARLAAAFPLLPVLGFLSFSAGYIPKLHVPLPVPRGAVTLFQGLRERHGHDGLRGAGLWLRDHAKVDASLTVASPRKAAVMLFYAADFNDSPARAVDVPPDMDLAALPGWLASEQVDFFVLEHAYLHTRPALEPLWKDPAAGAALGLRSVHEVAGILVVFAVIPRTPPEPQPTTGTP